MARHSGQKHKFSCCVVSDFCRSNFHFCRSNFRFCRSNFRFCVSQKSCNKYFVTHKKIVDNKFCTVLFSLAYNFLIDTVFHNHYEICVMQKRSKNFVLHKKHISKICVTQNYQIDSLIRGLPPPEVISTGVLPPTMYFQAGGYALLNTINNQRHLWWKYPFLSPSFPSFLSVFKHGWNWECCFCSHWYFSNLPATVTRG